jgi:hypothetical protein
MKAQQVMKRFSANVGVAILTFSIGTVVWLANPLRHTAWTVPLAVTVTPHPLSITADGEAQYFITVKNVSDRSVRGYSLGLGCTPFVRQKVKTLPQPVENSCCFRLDHC